MWLSTVLTLTSSWAATSLLALPRAIRRSNWTSRSVSGKGVVCTVDGRRVVLWNARLLKVEWQKRQSQDSGTLSEVQTVVLYGHWCRICHTS